MSSYADADFERNLIDKISINLNNGITTVDKLNAKLAESAEGMRLSILGKDAKVKNDKPLEVVDAYIKENMAELVDPLNAREKRAELQDNLDTLLKEIDTQIKVSNATTVIEF